MYLLIACSEKKELHQKETFSIYDKLYSAKQAAKTIDKLTRKKYNEKYRKTTKLPYDDSEINPDYSIYKITDKLIYELLYNLRDQKKLNDFIDHLCNCSIEINWR